MTEETKAKTKILSIYSNTMAPRKKVRLIKSCCAALKPAKLKLGRTHGAGKTVSIQVRKKRTYVKRPADEDEVKAVEEVKPLLQKKRW